MYSRFFKKEPGSSRESSVITFSGVADQVHLPASNLHLTRLAEIMPPAPPKELRGKL
jgi:hypothetical protein